jgi:hypothetical protein
LQYGEENVKSIKWALLSNGDIAKGNEYAFGWYDPGRFAYRLEKPERIEPVTAKGQLGLWEHPSLTL